MAKMSELLALGVEVPKHGWYDTFNDCVYWKREEALRAALGGNKLLRLDGLRRKPIEELQRVTCTCHPPKSERELTAFNFVFVWLHTSAVQREYVYNDFRIQDFRREYRRACRT